MSPWRILHEATCLCGSGEWRVVSPGGTLFDTTVLPRLRWSIFSVLNTITPGELP